GALVMYTLKFIIETRNIKTVTKSVGNVCYTTVMNGTTSIVEMCGILAGSQITVSLINLTGFGVKLSDVIVTLGQGSPLMSLFFSMIVCIILGMGLPTTAAYVLGAAVLAPPLIALGFQPLFVHLFIFYFACLSAITPPVCVAVFMASGLAKANWVKVGGLSCMIALPAFVIPFSFVYDPALLLIGSAGAVIFAIITALIGVVMIGISVSGYLTHPMGIPNRIVFVAGGVLLLFPNALVSFIGAAISAVAVVWSLAGGKRYNAHVRIS
ncbi:MAG TPA: TRAP transporter large permease subunit, partial [Sphaerochaeta sp.]|nr:TRAP transporter large permease subunit [Sphaerochaeta sp.]